MKNLRELMNRISDLGGEIQREAAALARDAGDTNIPLKDIQKRQGALQDKREALRAMQEEYRALETGKETQLKPMEKKTNKEEKKMSNIRKSNEYAQAFAYAVVNGIGRKAGMANEKMRPLYDALTEGGGEPVGTDGGFLVPEDIENQIIELKRALNPMAPLFGAENVNAPKGWRVVDTAPTKGMALVEEMGTIGDDEEPAFKQVPFEVKKYAQIIPVSNELAADNVANLFAYLARWFAKKAVITENGLIISALTTNLTAEALGTKPLNGLKTVFNKTLDPAISAGAVIICNQSGFDALDQLEDDMGRGLLQPDPVNATQYRALGHNVHVFSDAQMPGKVMYIGDGTVFGTMFTRQGFEVASTDIGGNAWKTDSIEVRGIARMGFSVFDKEAMAARSFGA